MPQLRPNLTELYQQAPRQGRGPQEQCGESDEPTDAEWEECTVHHANSKHDFNPHSRPKGTFDHPKPHEDFEDWRIKVEDYFSSNLRLMGKVLEEVAVRTEPVSDEMVQRSVPHLETATLWS